MIIDRYEDEQARAAAAEAARIGGEPGDQRGHPAEADPALRPVYEAGGGEAEGFEEAEEELIDHASHGDQQPAHAILRDEGSPEEPGAAESSEADHERSSEYDPDGPEQQ